jgi:hypothetical protein
MLFNIQLNKEKTMTKDKKTKSHKDRSAALLYEILNDPIQCTCKTKFMQICHLCDSMICGDNTNPLVARIKELEKKIK